MSPLVTYEDRDGVALITMDDGKVNALSSVMWSELNAALDRAESTGAVAVISGRPGVFSGGFDLKVLRAGEEDAEAMLDAGFDTAQRVLSSRVPVVAAATGHAVAMAAFLVLSCDYRVGVDGPFRIVANEVAIGLPMPHGIVELCRQRLSPSHLSRAMSLAEPFEGQAAVTAGFLDEVVAEDRVVTRALERASELGALDRHAYLETKQRVREAALAEIARGFSRDREERELIGRG
jgi:enoyl-CoA hydratase